MTPRQRLEATGQGGGFILSTGDQVGDNTPIENLEAMIPAGRRFGVYDAYGMLSVLPLPA